MKILFISWGKEIELNKLLAEAIDANFSQIYVEKIWGLKLPAIIRYLIQSYRTLRVLRKEKADIIYVQNPPIFAPMLVWFYCLGAKSKLAIDSHTAAFWDKKWRIFFPLFKFISRKAILNTCHNYKNLEILKKWKIEPALSVQFENPKYDIERLKSPLENNELNQILASASLPILMVNRFAGDDEWQTVVETARLMSEATFFLTGDPALARPKIKKDQLPANVVLTGYLPHEEFLKLMAGCRAVLALTSRKDTVLWSVREAMALIKPLVVTDSEALRHYFSTFAVFSRPLPEELKAKINEAINNEAKIKENIQIFLKKDAWRRAEDIAKIKDFLYRTK
jgi:glycosyltransferase involved in cell wall biosynthesis